MIITENSPKLGRNQSQDIVGRNRNFFWLIDGATPIKGEDKITLEFVRELDKCLYNSCNDLKEQSLSDIISLKEIDRQIAVLEKDLTDAQLAFATFQSLKYVKNEDGSYEQMQSGQDLAKALEYLDNAVLSRQQGAETDLTELLKLEEIKDFGNVYYVSARLSFLFFDISEKRLYTFTCRINSKTNKPCYEKKYIEGKQLV